GATTHRLLSDPALLLGQCCGYDLVYGFSSTLRLLGTPRYTTPGCAGTDYRSFVLARADAPARDLADLRGGVCVVNGFASHSGTNAPRHLVAPLSRDGRFFRQVVASGSHLASLDLLRAGRADVMAMDGVLHALLARDRPEALAGTRILCQTELVPTPPFVTAANSDPDAVDSLRAALADGFDDPDAADAKAELRLDGVSLLPMQDYARIVELEAAALGHGYLEMHATTRAT
ncbi:MAG: phosphate ABC transporter substrate-binding protein, partial [Alphaproteobacteria bacterium]|nr:phosphate ABC transporter substrate-binding protein [Alphaproteobacteria bacterium]